MSRNSLKDTVPLPPVTLGDRRPTLSSGGRDLDELPVGTTLGRYVILELRGAGAMGVVYAAYDPKLDRRVALKLLRPDVDDAEEAAARLLLEAKALAKLSHPNVVTVHDAGLIGEVVFVEMEFVEGTRLDVWEKGKSAGEILDAYAQAGQGLSAAHAAGLVHRDFKPSNVIVAADGRVRVLDFGIARAVAGANASASEGARTAPPKSAPPDAADEVRATPSQLPTLTETHAGVVLGTPAYMPPEQWKGRADARADQYAFAVSLFEALHGVLPFEPPRCALPSDADRGPIAARPADSKAPSYVDRALVRALSFSPADRFGSMDELLSAVRNDPRVVLRRRVFVALGAASVVLASLLGLRYQSAREAAVCGRTADRLAGAWDEAKATAVREALARSKNPTADDAWLRTRTVLDAYATRWVSMRKATCEETRRGAAAATDAALGAKLVCLDGRLRELHALTDVLASDPDLVHEAVKAASALTPVETCTNASMRDAPPSDPFQRARAEEIRGQIAEAESRRLAARPKAARPIASAAVEAARTTKLRAVEAAALLALGRAEKDDGDYKAAAQTTEQAAWAAEAARDDATLVSATTDLAMLVGYRLADHAAAGRWEQHALAALERHGPSDPLTAQLAEVRSALARQRQDLPAALEHAQRAVELQVRAQGPRHVSVARMEHNLGNTLVALVRYDDAMVHYERAREIYEEALGVSHPDGATVLVSEAIVQRKRGDADAALALYRRALERLVVARGADHPDVALTVNNMGIALLALGKVNDARASFEHALQIRRKVYATEHPLVASSYVNMAAVDSRMKLWPAARANLERAIAMYEKLGGRDNPSLAPALVSLAELAIDEKRPKDGIGPAERALALRTKKLGPDHPDVGSALTALARCHLAAGDAARALPLAERASLLLAKGNPRSRADALFALARALRGTGGDRARARASIDDAIAIYEVEDGTREELEEARAFVATNDAWLRGG